MKNDETPMEMELGIVPVNPTNNDKPIYRQRKKYFKYNKENMVVPT